jgi:polyhydroxybutyrate depolymerase
MGGGGTDPLIVARPYQKIVPPAASSGNPIPLVLVLHGYTSSGAEQVSDFGLEKLANDKGFIVAYPDGVKDAVGNRFWNADDACCDFFGPQALDDVAYLTAVIDDVKKHHTIDPKRVFVVGHSNGAFMSHRLACDRADRIAAIVALAGDVWNDDAKCDPSEGVSVLQVHGTLDETILYTGGWLVRAWYPSAKNSVSTWGAKNQCTGALAPTGTPMDLDSSLSGAETTSEAFSGCAPGTAAELWTIKGGKHSPSFNANWPVAFYDWLMAHPKP